MTPLRIAAACLLLFSAAAARSQFKADIAAYNEYSNNAYRAKYRKQPDSAIYYFKLAAKQLPDNPTPYDQIGEKPGSRRPARLFLYTYSICI